MVCGEEVLASAAGRHEGETEGSREVKRGLEGRRLRMPPLCIKKLDGNGRSEMKKMDIHISNRQIKSDQIFGLSPLSPLNQLKPDISTQLSKQLESFFFLSSCSAVLFMTLF